MDGRCTRMMRDIKKTPNEPLAGSLYGTHYKHRLSPTVNRPAPHQFIRMTEMHQYTAYCAVHSTWKQFKSRFIFMVNRDNCRPLRLFLPVIWWVVRVAVRQNLNFKSSSRIAADRSGVLPNYTAQRCGMYVVYCCIYILMELCASQIHFNYWRNWANKRQMTEGRRF